MISLYNNTKAAKSGNILRHASVVGHTSKLITKLAKVDIPVGHVCKDVVDTFNAAAKSSKAVGALKKGIKLTRYTDPISATCAMIRVGKSDSPGRTFVEETSDLVGMFVIEGAMIKHAKSIGNIKGIKQMHEGLLNFSKNTKGFGQLPAVVYGVLFTLGSMAGSAAFRKGGEWLADKMGLPEAQKEPSPEVSPDGKKKYFFG